LPKELQREIDTQKAIVDSQIITLEILTNVFFEDDEDEDEDINNNNDTNGTDSYLNETFKYFPFSLSLSLNTKTHEAH
jgi:hypothetical protein